MSYDANADESRYLVDPARAAQYQQAFLAKSQRLADVGKVGIFGYDAALAADIRAYHATTATCGSAATWAPNSATSRSPASGRRRSARCSLTRSTSGPTGCCARWRRQPGGRGRFRHRHRTRAVRLGVQPLRRRPVVGHRHQLGAPSPRRRRGEGGTAAGTSRSRRRGRGRCCRRW